MDDRTTTATVSAEQQAAYRGGTKLRQQYPTVAYLRRRASRRIPASRSNTATAAPAPIKASGATGPGSTRWNWCRVTA
jgi:hypothetical protein